MTPEQQRQARRWRKSGEWTEITERTYLASPGEPTGEQLAWAAVLHCGDKAALAGRNALVLHGWRDDLKKPFDVVSPVAFPVAPEWIRVRRVVTAVPLELRPRRVDAHDAVLQAGAWATTSRQAMFIVVSALQQQIVAVNRLRQLIQTRPRLHRRSMIAGIIEEYADGSQSLNELDLGRICASHGLPAPTRQVRHVDAAGRVRSIDAEFETAAGVVRVEIEGMQHFDPANWLNDLRRSNGLVLTGNAPHLRYSSWTIRWEPSEFVSDMRALLHLEVGPSWLRGA